MASASVAVLNSATARKRVADGAWLQTGMQYVPLAGGYEYPHAPPAIQADGLPAGTGFRAVPAGKRKQQAHQCIAGLQTRPLVVSGTPWCLRLLVRCNEKNPKILRTSERQARVSHASSRTHATVNDAIGLYLGRSRYGMTQVTRQAQALVTLPAYQFLYESALPNASMA